MKGTQSNQEEENLEGFLKEEAFELGCKVFERQKNEGTAHQLRMPSLRAPGHKRRKTRREFVNSDLVLPT